MRVGRIQLMTVPTVLFNMVKYTVKRGGVYRINYGSCSSAWDEITARLAKGDIVEIRHGALFVNNKRISCEPMVGTIESK